jgi:PAS domain S-box-containing protein
MMRALEAERVRISQFFENLPLPAYKISLEGRILDCNKAAVEMLGYNSKDELVGKPLVTTIYAQGSRGKAEKLLLEWKETGRLRDEELQVITKQGKTFDVLLNVDTIYDEKGKPLYSISTQLDITERKGFEEDLRKQRDRLVFSETRYRRLFEAAYDGILILDSETGRIADANPFLTNMLGYSHDELLGKTLWEIGLFRDAERSRTAFDELRKRGYIRYEDLPLETKDGRAMAVEFVSNLYAVNGQKVIQCNIRDITDRKRAETQVQRHAEHLEELVQEKTRELAGAQRLSTIGETAGMVGHDLRNPLQAILGTLYLAKRRADRLFQAHPDLAGKLGLDQLFQELDDQVKYMNKIVSDLQDFARPLKPERIDTNIGELVDNTLSTIGIPGNVRVFREIGDDFPRLMIDPEMIKRVLTNLVTNAIQAMPDGGELRIVASRTGDATLISIQDTGVGIAQEGLGKMWTPLFTTKAKGSGLGLKVCRRLVQAHDGDIIVQSELGKGSTFSIKLPLP